MGKYNEELVKAGIILAGEGLHPSSKGARVRFSGDKRTVIDGPFAETKELIAGFWILQCRNKAEVIEWMRRCPNPYPHEGGYVEIRNIIQEEMEKAFQGQQNGQQAMAAITARGNQVLRNFERQQR